MTIGHGTARAGLLAVASTMLAVACDFPFTNPNDPARCQPRCSSSELQAPQSRHRPIQRTYSAPHCWQTNMVEILANVRDPGTGCTLPG